MPLNTSDLPFLGKHAERIQGVLSCFDRVLFRGHLPLSHPRGLEGFLGQQGVLLKQYLEALAGVDDQRQARTLLDRATRPSQLHGRRKRALQPLQP
jgi:hypothetical protein